MKKLVIDNELFLNLLKEGKNDSEIGRILNINHVSVRNYRLKMGFKSSNFTYKTSIDEFLFLQLYNLKYSDEKIARKLNISKGGVYNYRKNILKLPNVEKYEQINFNNFQREVLIGTLLGDGYLCINKTKTSVGGHIAHSLNQENYCKLKHHILLPLSLKLTYNTATHSKTKRESYEIRFHFKQHPYLLEFYEKLYHNKTKVISSEILEEFSEVSLAFLYMDDGSKTRDSYSIATNCFSRENIEQFSSFLEKKFNLKTSIFESKVLYIKKESRLIFENLISKYIIEELKYKLHSSPVEIL